MICLMMVLVMTIPSQLSDLDLLYGKCRRNDRGERCLCLKAEEGWAVDLCADWISISEVAGRPITDYNDLLAVMREIRESNEARK